MKSEERLRESQVPNLNNMLLLKAHRGDLSWYLHKAKKNWVCRCNILILMEHDKTLLFRHCEKCKNKFTKLRDRELGIVSMSLTKIWPFSAVS